MANYAAASSNGANNSKLWIANANQSTDESFEDLESSSGSVLTGNARQTYGEFTFNSGGLTYVYSGEWTLDYSGTVLLGSVEASGYYDGIQVFNGNQLVSSYSGERIEVDFGSATTGLLSPVTDLLGSVIDRLLGDDGPGAVENLHLDATPNLRAIAFSGDDVVTGGAGRDVLYGEAGNDTLSGGSAGADRLLGGVGDDLYRITHAGETITEFNQGGLDSVVSTISFNLTNNLENLTLEGPLAINGGGNLLNNRLVGNDENNGLSGGARSDTLVGGGGNDRMEGGAGNDVFVFTSLDDSGTGRNRDVIKDFTVRHDKIDLSAIQAVTGAGADQAFTFIGEGAFTNQAGQLHQFANGVNTVVEGDVTGDGKADFQIVLLGDVTLHGYDFLL